MKITVITVALNSAEYIEDCIRSVICQDYENIEYIIVDGGSTDGTVEILRQYGNQIKWVSEPDKGHADAINKGWLMSNGEILAWLNADNVSVDGSDPGAHIKVGRQFISCNKTKGPAMHRRDE